MRKSVWTESVTLPEYSKLDGDKKTEVLIIGGGLCGILCAWTFKKRGCFCFIGRVFESFIFYYCIAVNIKSFLFA